jgi:hypothetical protein
MPASVIRSTAACRTRSRLRWPFSVLAGPRRRGAVAASGDFALYDTRRPYEVVCGASRDQPVQMMTFMFPPSLLPLSRNRVRQLAAVPFPAGDPVEAARLSAAALEVLATRLARALDVHDWDTPQAHRHALLTTVQAFIQRHLGEAGLSPAMIAAAHHMSLRSLQSRLLLFHLPKRVAVLARLWDAVAPGGQLVVQDYDIRSISVLPDLASVGELGRVITGAFGAAGADVYVGARLAQLFAQAGVGAPDGTDVCGRVEPLGTGRVMLESVYRSLLPAALAHGITTEDGAAATLAAFDRDVTRFADRPMLWPLMIGAWKRKGLA